MKLRDVPLGLLPTFEAAGRLGSFAAAAAELHLTPSAISQQIRALEETLGVQLFARNGRAAMLTDEGERYLVEVRRSLAELAASTERLQRRRQGRVMRMSTVAMAAHEFVLPRLRAFRERFPDIELRIEASNDIVDLRLRGYDAAIRVSAKDDELVSQRMGGLEAALVCAPELAREIRSASDLARFTLLDFSGNQELQLQALQREARVPVQAPANVMSFESCFEALRAAEHGIGSRSRCSQWRHRGCRRGAWLFRSPRGSVASATCTSCIRSSTLTSRACRSHRSESSSANNTRRCRRCPPGASHRAVSLSGALASVAGGARQTRAG